MSRNNQEAPTAVSPSTFTTSWTSPWISYNANEKTVYAYDEYGRLASAKEYRRIAENEYIENRYAYDSMDRVVEEVQTADKSHDGVPVEYAYNYAGQLSEVRYPVPNGERVTGYEYDGYGRIESIRYVGEQMAWYDYTGSGLLATVTTDLTFNTSSEKINIRNYEYNSAGLIGQINYLNGNGVAKETHTYTYDARGNILTYDSINLCGSGTAQRLSRAYEYNDRNIVTRENERDIPTGNVFSRTYEYDGAGNRTRIGKWHTGEIWRHFTYTYNEANQLLAYTYENTGEEWEKYTYNVKGQLIRVKDLRVSNPYVYYNTYDSKGQLAWTEGGGVRNRYYYDHTGMRVRKKVTVDSTDKTTDYIYRGSGLLYTEDKSNGSRYENLLDPSGTVLGGRRSGHHYTFYHQDILGSTTTILDDEGVMKNRYEYTPDGEVERKTSTTPNEIQFTGHVHDESSGFTYMNARYYEPDTARFLTPDTYTGNPYNPNTQNVYSYTGNNPVNYVDPTGHRRMRADGGEGRYRTVAFYYINPDNPNSSFTDQANSSAYFDAENGNVMIIPVTSAQDFIDAWNDLDDSNIGDVFLYLHGGEGKLYFKGETLSFSGDSSFDNLNDKNVNGTVYLFSCHGGQGEEGNNVAWMFAQKTDTEVRACTVGVSYKKLYGRYHAKIQKAAELNPFLTAWHTYYYENGGNAASTQYPGRWAKYPYREN